MTVEVEADDEGEAQWQRGEWLGGERAERIDRLM